MSDILTTNSNSILWTILHVSIMHECMTMQGSSQNKIKEGWRFWDQSIVVVLIVFIPHQREFPIERGVVHHSLILWLEPCYVLDVQLHSAGAGVFRRYVNSQDDDSNQWNYCTFELNVPILRSWCPWLILELGMCLMMWVSPCLWVDGHWLLWL